MVSRLGGLLIVADRIGVRRGVVTGAGVEVAAARVAGRVGLREAAGVRVVLPRPQLVPARGPIVALPGVGHVLRAGGTQVERRPERVVASVAPFSRVTTRVKPIHRMASALDMPYHSGQPRLEMR